MKRLRRPSGTASTGAGPSLVGRSLALPALGHEPAERQLGRHRAVAPAVDEVHRDVERPVAIRAEDGRVLEHERQDAGPRVVGIAPDPRAVALIATRLRVDDRRGGPQRGQDRGDGVQRAQLAAGVGLVGEIEVGLHRGGALHHLEAARAHGGHVRAHHGVPQLGHPRDVVAPTERTQPADQPCEPEVARGASERLDVLLEIGDEHPVVGDRPRGELELATGLQGQLRATAGQRDHVATLDGGCPATLGEPVEQRGDPARAVVGRRLAGVDVDADQLVLGAHPPRFARLASTVEVLGQLVDRTDRNGVLFVDEVHAVRGL